MSDPTTQQGEEAPTGSSRHERLEKVKHVAMEEFRSYVVATVYIWVLLGMFTLHEEIALRTHGGVTQALPFAPHGIALINALVLGKVALVVESLRLGSRIKAQPLIYPIVIEAFLLAALFIAMHVLESVIAGWVRGEALAASVPAVGGGGLAGLVFSTVSFFVAMVPFCAFRQITIAIGWPRMRALLLGPPPGGAA
ncbi:hypothetical protein AAFN86_19775 [Roseomonas sp. CAU 1739]|uniref:hypothetical protein n=1 Tax=Roseomonas sp. CAU 1739 TaxID=3140364 RepID=UPI00325AF67F